MSSSVKQQVIEDLQMAGLAPGTRKMYLATIVRFVKRTRIRPQDATESQVTEYLRGRIRSGHPLDSSDLLIDVGAAEIVINHRLTTGL